MEETDQTADEAGALTVSPEDPGQILNLDDWGRSLTQRKAPNPKDSALVTG
jgi:hypothetical protein